MGGFGVDLGTVENDTVLALSCLLGDVAEAAIPGYAFGITLKGIPIPSSTGGKETHGIATLQ